MLHRIEVRSKPGHASPASDAALREARASGLGDGPSQIDHADVYLIEGELNGEAVQRIAGELLADPITQTATIGADEPHGDAYIEVQPLAGVMDPAAQAVELAVRAMLGIEAKVQTGHRYDLHGVDEATARTLGERCFANTVIQAIHDAPFHPDALPRGEAHDFQMVEVPLRDLDDAALERLSRDAHLFLCLEEMQAIQTEYQTLGREPREIELETLAQTWSEHCVHKTLKATIRYREESDTTSGTGVPPVSSPVKPDRSGHTQNPDGSITINNLLKSTVAAATHELMADGIDWCLSVFVDNAGIIAFDDDHAVCFKCETHNHPSAIEPYGGAATGIGGCIRDIIGTGLAAKPIASTDVFCVAYPDGWSRDQGTKAPRHEDSDDSARCLDASMPRSLPTGCLHPRRILRRVVDGVRDYGNRMGIPTVNGAVWFDDRYVGNPLVYCGSIGVMPRDRIAGDPNPGDRIIAIGGRTGRDGIHGATFSSAELTDTHADEFSHAVQIGNPVTEKVVLDLILEARDYPVSGVGQVSDLSVEQPNQGCSISDDGSDSRPTRCLFTAITDCGAGGFSSAVGEMGEKLGAYVTLENAPLKYEGLTPTEIWISEAQERMVLAVPKENIAALQSICDKHGGEMCDLGYFGTEGQNLILTYSGDEVGRLPMEFLHDGIPQTTKEAVWQVGQVSDLSSSPPTHTRANDPQINRDLIDLPPDEERPLLRCESFVARDPFPAGEPSPNDLTGYLRALPHLELEEATYFVTWRTTDNVMLSESERDAVLASLLHWHDERFEVYVACVMPDHVHCLVRPLEGWSLRDVIGGVKRFTARTINKRRGTQGPLWQDERFDHIVRDEMWFTEFVYYILRNPVTAGLVGRPSEYRWTVLGTGLATDDGQVVCSRTEETGRMPVPPLQKTGRIPVPPGEKTPSVEEALLALLAHPNIASKHWIIRQYDHEVQGNSVVKPLVGPAGEGPGDAAVLLPVEGSTRGLAIGNGLATGFSDDPYVMTLMAIDECVRNMVCVGADPDRIAILDNFCWPSCNDPHNLASLVRAAEACYDGAKAYRTPFISGKDSLNNQFTTEDGETIKIPPTLLISGMGIVPDVMKCVTMDAKKPGNVLVLVGAETLGHCGGSHYQQVFGGGDARTPRVDLQRGPATARAVHKLISRGVVQSAHDVSDGGLLCAVAEMCIGGDLGFEMEAMGASAEKLFSEEPCRYLLEIEASQVDVVKESLGSDISYTPVGKFTTTTQFVILAGEFDIEVDTLRTTWLGTLDW